jgi:type I restriction enzyme S subunit
MKQGWEIKKLGEVCRFINGRAYSKPELLDKGKYPVLRVGNFFTNNQWYYSDLELDEDKYCDKGDLLYAWSASFGPRIWEGEKVIYHYHIWKVIPDTKIVSKEFLFQLLNWDTEALKTAHGTGTTMMHVGKGSIEKRLVPIPPLPEQQRIVSILDECFAAIDKAKANAEQNLKNAKELFESYLKGVFKNKGEGWEEKTIGDIGSPKMCKRIFKEQTTAVGDIPFYKIGTFGKEPDAFISRAIYDEFCAKYSFPKKGDVLISASGTIGRRVRYDGEPAYFQDSNIVWIENDEKQVSNDFLYEFYGACNWGSTKGATISRLYNDNLKNIKITYPKSRTEQEKIVFQLETMRNKTQKLEAVYQKKIADLEELKKSILDKAFKGELRGGEPAEPKTEKALAI